jgi:ATP-dependent HslUV protease ATP-binding subunit HslU
MHYGAREEEASRLVNEDIKARAIESVEQTGIVFLDESTKSPNGETLGPDVSRERAARSAAVRSCTVSTKYGMVKTDHILFIASGAFRLTKPSDLIPELQGRCLSGSNSRHDCRLWRILTELNYSPLQKGVEIMTTIYRVPVAHFRARAVVSNTSPTRPYRSAGRPEVMYVMERLIEDISFEATERSGHNDSILIDAAYVDARLGDLARDQDLSRYIL